MTATTLEPTAADVAELHAVIADVERGFNTNQPDLLMRRMAEDAIVTTAVGAVLRGRPVIDEATRAGLARGALTTATAHCRVSDLTLVAPDVAVVTKLAWSTADQADRGEAPEMSALYVFVRRAGAWWIVRRQNTLTPPADRP
ncbi:YybH family protein [Nocardioides daejeonensis]|uniref:YybH family protein n=1 Tax=Nocardioides daejeonensis TaxID=1046556 RepID=UPI0019506A05|nr:SgcJ/EcaC family oxidoreductase [Nocardioides daejeonensis]